MNLLRIKDNSSYYINEFSCIDQLSKRIANKNLQLLESEGVFIFPEIVKDTEDLTREQMIIQKINDSFLSGNIMGFIGYGNDRLIIESRFSNHGEDFFFQYLLEKVLDIPNLVNLDTDANQDNKLFNYLLFLFPYYLRQAMRKGAFKKYVRNKYNDSNVKGSIDIVRHIEKNTPFVGNIAYSQREFSYDNHLMELIRHTIEYIKRKPYGRHLLSKIKDEVNLVVEATPGYDPYDRQRLLSKNKSNTIRHAFFKEYLALQKLCILILQNQKHQIGAGSKQIYGILFDGAWLWEEYINTIIEDIFFHPMNKGRSGAQWLFEGNIGLIYPDFIGKNSTKRIIADAKYKPNKNIRSHDYMQILTYMFRFEADIGYFLYPESGSSDNETELFLNRGSSFDKVVTRRNDKKIIKQGLKIPQDAFNYKDFIRKIMIQEQIFKECFSNKPENREIRALLARE